MPMPKPNKDESRDDFISRFMGNPAMIAEYPDEKQRVAVANTQWDKREMKLETVNVGDIEIFEAGIWKGVKYGPKDIDEFIENFQNGVAEPFVTIDHSDKASGQFKDALKALALGFVEKLERRGSKLIAWFKQVPKTVADLIEAGALKKRSIEFLPNVVVNGRRYKNVLQGVTFHGANGLPEVNTLSDFLNLYKSNLQAMDKDQKGIESLENSDFQHEEIRMDENTFSLKRDEYSDIQKKLLKIDAVMSDNVRLTAEMDEAKANAAKVEEENVKLKAEIDEQKKVQADALKDEAQKYIAKHVNEGRIVPAHKDRYVSEYIRYKETEPENFKSFTEDIEGRGKVVDFKPLTTPEEGVEEGAVYDPEKMNFKAGATINYDEIDERIKNHAKAKGISYEEASKALGFANADELGDKGVVE